MSTNGLSENVFEIASKILSGLGMELLGFHHYSVESSKICRETVSQLENYEAA